ncbi:MAG: glycosyl hydrolase [Terriglobia bacterium]
MKRAKLHPLVASVITLVGVTMAVREYRAGALASPAQPTPAEEEKSRLLEPAALRNAPPPASVEDLRRNFQDPPNEFRPAPLWVWNDEMDPERIKEQLRQFKQQGMGGVFIHPRPGLMTEYLGDEWFRLWRLALDESKRLGLLCNIYDENSYPSGFAGGHVPSLAPDTAAQYVQAEIVESPPSDHGPAMLGLFAIERDSKGQPVRASRIAEPDIAKAKGPVAVFSLRRASGNPWTAQFPYVDLTNPETSRWFIRTTFEAYKQHVGEEFGKAVKWSFDDEPLLATGGAYEPDSMALPLSYRTLAEFKKRNGYDLRDALPSLFWDVGDWRRVRFDYWQTLHDLWKENYFRPLFEWCDRNGLQFTGHFMEHEWPYPWISPDDASMYAFEHMPGIDMLVGAELRTKGADPHMLFTIRQVASVAHQLGRRAFSETYGVAGWDSTLEHYKRMGDWLIVNGVNFINQHLSFTTIRGARKRDHPQSFSDISAWWPYYRLHADHTARLSYVLSNAQPRHRVLVLEPTTSGFLWARRGGETPELAKLRESYDQLNQYLADHQIDFDLGDEYMLEWFGEARDGKLTIGKATYDLVVWPEHMINVRHQSVVVLQRFLEGGGEILALGEPAAFVDGRPDGVLKRLKDQFSSKWASGLDLPALVFAIHGKLRERVKFLTDIPGGVGYAMLTTNDEGIFQLFTNAGSKQVNAKVWVDGGPGLEEWDTTSGRIGEFPAQMAADGGALFDLEIPPAGSRLFLISAPHGAPKSIAKSRELPVNNLRVTRASPNVLVLDYCDLRLAGESFPNINTWQANWKIWQAHGFERPAWDNATQFNREILDRPPFPADSGFEATFHFTVSEATAAKGAELAVELPELYKITLNGRAVDFAHATRWLDDHLKSVGVEPLLKTGENLLQITAKPFDVHMELENIYLRGDFALEPQEQGFAITKARALEFGSWAKQGYPFYSDSVLYETTVRSPRGVRNLRISFPRWEGSVAEVLFDGNHVQTVGWQPYSVELESPPGPHVVGLRVVATPRNLFGPFHNPTRPRMIAWPGAWSEFPEHQPPGNEYDVLDYGLVEPFRVEAVH